MHAHSSAVRAVRRIRAELASCARVRFHCVQDLGDSLAGRWLAPADPLAAGVQ